MNTTGTRMAVLAALAVALSGCSTTQFNPGGVRARMTTLVEQHKYQEAREVEVKAYPKTDYRAGQPSPEEAVKAELLETLVNPSEAAWTATRIRGLEAQVDEALSRGNDEEARQAIYGYGVTPTRQRSVDAVVYLAKCAYLNSRVNPATLARWERFTARYVDGSIKAGDFAKAAAALRRIERAAAYPERIDELLGDSADRAADQHADAEAAGALAGGFQRTLYTLIAPRAGFQGDLEESWKDLLGRLEQLQRLRVPTSGFEPGFTPDWTALKRVLADFRQALVEDDVSEEDAKIIADALFAGLKALVPDGRNGLTTYELNNRLAAMQAEAQARLLTAIADERARIAEEAARAAQQQLEERTQAAAERLAERLQALDRIMGAIISQQAAAIDFASRENAFTAAISDRLEPAINRMLGEGARVLRLHRTRGSITPAQATSLLLAALYMGFDDVAGLALTQGADINGTGEKDIDGRTPYLLAVQYGFKGSAEKILAKADTARRDANGAGAVHYAVRAGDTSRLLSLIGAGADASTPDRDGTTPLMLAARLRNPSAAAMLLAKSDIDATDSKGRAAVHFSAAAGDLLTLRTLVAAGASTSGTTDEGDDLPTLACAANAADVLDYLLDDLKLPVGERPVSWCVIHSKVLPLKTLVAHGGALTDRHLAAAVKLALPDMVRYLVEQGCDVNDPEVHKAAKGLADKLDEDAANRILANRDFDFKLPEVRDAARDFAGKIDEPGAAVAQSLDAPWTALSADGTPAIATTKESPAVQVLLYLHSQGYRPVTPNGR